MGPSIDIGVYLGRDATGNFREGFSDQAQKIISKYFGHGPFSFVVRPCTVVSIIPQFLQFIELELPL
jgi:hypothetical protein